MVVGPVVIPEDFIVGEALNTQIVPLPVGDRDGEQGLGDEAAVLLLDNLGLGLSILQGLVRLTDQNIIIISSPV